ncbi:MAG: hypothetical protein J1F67_05135 [Muribaculaceae bacterium]|nr:hypothetical protein [Muribaculaceae bacterium]
MKYTGEFYSIDSRAYRIEITTPSSGADQILKLSGTPFVASVKGDDKTLYSPIRCGGATVGILSENYIFDLYSGQAKGVKVTLHEETPSGDIVRWTGYVSPTVYDQGYDDYLEEISLDCVDGVAVLKDIPFRREEKDITTFLDIITYCLKESGCFRAFYISDNVQLTAGGTEPVIEKFRISTSNFFSQKKDVNQTDDDVAWSCYDVLYHILQWLGYTLTVHGDEVYIVDYDAVTNRYDTYHRYSLEDGSRQYVTLSASKKIKGEDYAANGTKLSLDEVYNKVTVKDEFNTYDNLLPQFGDINIETNVTGGADSAALALPPSVENNILGNSYVFHYTINPGSHDSQEVLRIVRFYDSPVFNFHKYSGTTDTSGNSSLWGEGNVKISSMLASNGAFYFRTTEVLVPYEDFWAWMLAEPSLSAKDRWERMGRLLGKVPEDSDYSMKPMILFRNFGTNRIGPGAGSPPYARTDDDISKKYPFMTLKNQPSSIFGGSNHIIRIKGSFRYHNDESIPFPLVEVKDIPYDGDKKFREEGFIWCKVKWGANYWDGKGWQSTDTWFELYFWDQETSPSDFKNSEIYNKEYNFCPNKNYLASLGEDGYIIPAPPDNLLEGSAEISFTTRDMWGKSRRDHWHPKGTFDDNQYCRTYSGNVFLTNIAVTAEVSPGLLSDADLDSDTCYTNVIDNGSVSPMNEISFKVCTDDGKKPSYSSVAISEGSSTKFVTVTYNKALVSREADTIGFDGFGGILRQEEHMVFKTASHYESPKVVFECTLHNEDFMPFTVFTDDSLGGRRFVIMEKETDYRSNSSTIKITEKE